MIMLLIISFGVFGCYQRRLCQSPLLSGDDEGGARCDESPCTDEGADVTLMACTDVDHPYEVVTMNEYMAKRASSWIGPLETPAASSQSRRSWSAPSSCTQRVTHSLVESTSTMYLTQ